jgi:hypothetical protein
LCNKKEPAYENKVSQQYVSLFLLALAVGCTDPSAPGVTRVINSDTIEVDIDGVIYKVHDIGLDAPELDDVRPKYSTIPQEATEYTRQ